jgi:hypothetical protein
MKRSIASLTITASLIGGAGAAFVFAPQLAGAQDDSSTTVPADDATAMHADRHAWVEDTLAQLVEDGVIDQAQADAVAAALEANRPEHGEGHGPGGRMGRGLDAAAGVIGIDEAALREALVGGETLAEVAEANGVSRQDLIDGLVAEAVAHLDEEVAEGDLTQERADEIEATLTERITAMVDGELPAGGPMGGPRGGHGPMGGRGGHGPMGGGAGPDADGTDTPSAAGASADEVTAA